MNVKIIVLLVFISMFSFSILLSLVYVEEQEKVLNFGIILMELQ